MHMLHLLSPMFKRNSLKITFAIALGLALAACDKKAPAPDTASTAAAAAKIYAVGTDAAYAPFESQNEKGELVGFSIDLLNAVAKKAGIEVKFINTPWEGIFNTLAQGDRDLLISSITITQERKQSMDFSSPYFDAVQFIAVKEGSKITKFSDLEKLKVGVQTGTTGDEVVSKLQGKTSTNIRRFESTPLALKELDAGGVEAVVADNGVVVNYVQNNASVKLKTVTDASFTPEQYGIAVKKGNAELLAKINKGLADMKADGTYAQMYSKYFGAASAVPVVPAASAAK
jgi:polar amino acid transport system substrate-binding protein